MYYVINQIVYTVSIFNITFLPYVGYCHLNKYYLRKIILFNEGYLHDSTTYPNIGEIYFKQDNIYLIQMENVEYCRVPT